ncbi:MAG: hypothetical protein R3B45_17240 [Bdellovibrionota bacterium]
MHQFNADTSFSKLARKQSCYVILILTLLNFTPQSLAGSKEQAIRIHSRIAGVPPSQEVLKEMTELVASGKQKEAASLAIANPNFLNITIFDMFAPFTNENETNRVNLSDYLATVIGMIRDNSDFRGVLTEDVIYTPPISNDTLSWSTDNNTWYEKFQEDNPESFSDLLVKGKQSIVIKPALQAHDQNVANFNDWAGILTTREFAVGYYFDGTNRAALRYLGKSFLCKDIDQLTDTTTPDYRIRQDISRQPAGNSNVFKSKCAGCHSGMDALSGAFAYFDATETKDASNMNVLRYTISPGKVHNKYFRDAQVFPAGYATKDDGWVNLWSEGANKSIGWTGPQKGSGVRSLGVLYSRSNEFARCMTKRVYARVCLKNVETLNIEEKSIIDELVNKFSTSNYNMKDLFAESSLKCLGD